MIYIISVMKADDATAYASKLLKINTFLKLS